MLPVAKFSALEIEYIHGNSITKSNPACSAFFVRSHLFIILGSPRCTKLPEIIAIL